MFCGLLHPLVVHILAAIKLGGVLGIRYPERSFEDLGVIVLGHFSGGLDYASG
ncbi:MAG: hypothetical protein JW384_03065 [Nitrosomonadaceae bacterium]|nr:hypothetical protein [Nitrosomonadaceae bacterium]